MHQMFPAFHLPEHVDGRGALCSTGLRRTRRRSSSRKLSEGGIAQVPRALTRFPPCLKARRQGERAQVPRALIRPPRHPPGSAAGQLYAQVPRALRCDSGTTRHTGKEDLPNDQLVRWYWQLMRSVRFYSHQLLRGAAQGSWAILPFWH